MKNIITNAFLSLSILGTFSAMAGTNSWTPVTIGSSGTSLAVFRFDDLNPFIGYAGTFNNGLFKTTNGGLDWFSIGPGTVAPHPFVSVSDFMIDPTNQSVLYGFALGWPVTYVNTVFKSSDGGSNWVAMGSGLPTFDSDLQPSPIAIDPNDPGTLLIEAHYEFAPTPPARLFRSTDGGTNWSEMITIGLSVQRVYQFAFDPFIAQKLYAVASGGVYISTNNGTNWSEVVLEGGATPTVICVDKSRPGTIVVGSNGGPFKSTDGGLTWVATPTPWEQSLAISLDEYMPDIIFSGGTGGEIFRSTDRGDSYHYLATLPELYPGYSPDAYLLEFEPATKTIFAGGFGGPLYSWTIDQPPTITCPKSLTLECTNGSAVGTLIVGLLDTNGLPLEVVWTVDGAAYQTNDIPSGGTFTSSNVTFTATFGEGEHTVVLSASNGQSTPVSCFTIVTVSDTIPPSILGISATPNLLWPPNHRMVPVSIVVDAVDNCDPSPIAQITQVTSNQPQGHFRPEWMITGPLSVDLRAERLGNRERTYTIYLEVSDSSGNKTTTTTAVTVPKASSVLR
jgi:hypothetical protein